MSTLGDLLAAIDDALVNGREDISIRRQGKGFITNMSGRLFVQYDSSSKLIMFVHSGSGYDRSIDLKMARSSIQTMIDTYGEEILGYNLWNESSVLSVDESDSILIINID